MKIIKLRDVMTDRLKEAHDFATEAYEGMTTRGSHKHLMFHIAGVAEIGLNHGLTETQLIACLLMNTLKETHIRLDQLKDRFSIEVVCLVKVLSQPIEWNKITDVSIAVIKISESINLLAKLNSGKLGDDYKREVMTEANILVTKLTPLGKALSLIDADLSILDILEELEKAYEEAKKYVKVVLEV